MKNLAIIRQRIVIALVVLGLIDAVALTYLLLPSRTDITAQRQALTDAEQEARRLTLTVGPLGDIGAKLKKADIDISDFYKNRLSSRYSEVVDEVGKVASKNRIAIGTVSYKE